MNDLPIKKLTALTKHFGYDLLDDYARCDELLSDFCGEYRLEVNLLVSVLREGCAKELLERAADGVVADDVYVRLVGQLQRNAGILAEYAEWGVRAVATALELKVVILAKTAPLVTASSTSYVPPYPSTIVPGITKPPSSIPLEHYDAVCNILLKSGSEWKDPSIWAIIDSDVKLLCAKARIDMPDIRNWMRFAWPSVETKYEAQEIKKQHDKMEAERLSLEKERIKKVETEWHNQHLKILDKWLNNLPEGMWDYDTWDDFIATLEPPINLKNLENRRDCSKTIVYCNSYVRQIKNSLVWPKNGNIAGKIMNFEDANNWVNKLIYDGHSDWRLPTKEELEDFIKIGSPKPFVWFNANGFNDVQDGWYWSASDDGGSAAWYIGMSSGHLNKIPKRNRGCVWPVRSGR